MQSDVVRDFVAVFKNESRVLVAYLFGSYAKGVCTAKSDVDIAVLLSEAPRNLLEYYLHLVNNVSKMLANDVDLIILNRSPPLLKHQIIKHGKIAYCCDEKARIEFEAKAHDEYLDFSRAIERYDECLIKQVLA